MAERLGWRERLAEGGLCCGWRGLAALKTCMTDGTIGMDWAFTVRCRSRGEGDISRGGEFWEEAGGRSGAVQREHGRLHFGVRGTFVTFWICAGSDWTWDFIREEEKEKERKGEIGALISNPVVRAFPTWFRRQRCIQSSAATNGSCLEAQPSHFRPTIYTTYTIQERKKQQHKSRLWNGCSTYTVTRVTE